MPRRCRVGKGWRPDSSAVWESHRRRICNRWSSSPPQATALDLQATRAESVAEELRGEERDAAQRVEEAKAYLCQVQQRIASQQQEAERLGVLAAVSQGPAPPASAHHACSRAAGRCVTRLPFFPSENPGKRDSCADDTGGPGKGGREAPSFIHGVTQQVMICSWW